MRSVASFVFVACAVPASAHAFSDRALFAESVDKGGSGGRYFSGSPADGYGCSVCHRGGKEPAILIDGIPDAPVAGTRYELVIHWPDPEVPHALQLELSTPAGTAPSVAVAMPQASRCDQLPSGVPAVYTVDVGMRRIVGVEDCHAASVTVSFIATGEPIGLSIAAVRSNEDGSVEGDGTYELRTVIGATYIATGGGGCHSTGGDAGLVFGLALLTAARRRRAR